MRINKKELLSFLASILLSLILTNFGLTIVKNFPENKFIGIITILIGFVLFYFSIYSSQIKKNEINIKELNERLEKLEKSFEPNKKLLNTIRDMVILNKIRKIK